MIAPILNAVELNTRPVELYGPRTEFSRWIHADRHRAPEETYDDYCVRYARAVARDTKEQFYKTLNLLRTQAMLPAGRQQVSVGRPFMTTAFNCFVSATIEDSIDGIFKALGQAARTMGAGGGIGYDFSTIRPSGEPVRGLGGMGHASGPVEFMKPFDAMCKVLVRSWGRGAMMGCLRVDHPDILRFINAKRNTEALSAFNISVLVTDDFMEALAKDGIYDLKFNDVVFGQARAWDVWGPIMESNWDWAEPGVIFIDRVNRLNPLYYCESISATNPCAEQPLPPYGCCLLGSYNMVKFLTPRHEPLPKLDESNPQILYLHEATGGKDRIVYDIEWEAFDECIEMSVRAYDNVIDRTVYPLLEQKREEENKRRMGIGPTGMADALAVMGYQYGSEEYLNLQDKILARATNMAYRTSAKLAKTKGSFPLFAVEKYAEGEFFSRLDEDVQDLVVRHGIRNGLLTSIAPTGTISLDADNVSSGIEPAYSMKQHRKVDTIKHGIQEFDLINYAYNFFKVEGKTANEITPEEHINVLCRAQFWTDSSISKTVNLKGQRGGQGEGVTFEQYEKLYLMAWEGGAKSCTTFNLTGKRMGILEDASTSASTAPLAAEVLPPNTNLQDGTVSHQEEGIACKWDPETGTRSCEG